MQFFQRYHKSKKYEISVQQDPYHKTQHKVQPLPEELYYDTTVHENCPQQQQRYDAMNHQMNEAAVTFDQEDYSDIGIISNVKPAFDVAYSELQNSFTKGKDMTLGAKKGTSMLGYSSLKDPSQIPMYATVDLDKKAEEREAKKTGSTTMAEDCTKNKHYQNILPDKKPKPPTRKRIENKAS